MRTLLVVAAIVVSATLAKAGTVEVRPTAPVATVALSDVWDVSRIDRGIQAKAKDQDVYVWVEAYAPDELDIIIAEHNAYWKDQGVVVTGRDTSAHEENGATVQITTEAATWKGQPTVLNYVEFNLGLPSKSNVVLTYWASPEGDKALHSEVGKILGSVTATEK